MLCSPAGKYGILILSKDSAVPACCWRRGVRSERSGEDHSVRAGVRARALPQICYSDCSPASPPLASRWAEGLPAASRISESSKFSKKKIFLIRVIAGTSVGALIGACYCSGLTLAEMEDVAHNVRFTSFARWTVSRCGFASNDRMVAFLDRTLKVKTFEELRIPLGVTATDFNTGEGVVFHSGS